MEHGYVLSDQKFNDVFDILVRDCGAFEEDRGNFLCCMMNGCREYRCCPRLGFGGKFRPITMSVDYYQDDFGFDDCAARHCDAGEHHGVLR